MEAPEEQWRPETRRAGTELPPPIGMMWTRAPITGTEGPPAATFPFIDSCEAVYDYAELDEDLVRVEEEERRPPTSQRDRGVLLSDIISQHEALPTLEIQSIDIGLISKEYADAIATVEVGNINYTSHGSLFDPRMGTFEKTVGCSTCKVDRTECRGHYGKIVLNTPVIHPLLVRQLIAVLRSVCNSCGGLLLSREDMEANGLLSLSGPLRLSALEERCKTCECIRKAAEPGTEPIRSCPSDQECSKNPKYLTRDSVKDMRIYYTCGGKRSERPIAEIAAILNAISYEDAELLGFRPTPPLTAEVEDILRTAGISNPDVCPTPGVSEIDTARQHALAILGPGEAYTKIASELERLRRLHTDHPRNFLLERIIVLPPCARRNIGREGVDDIDPLSKLYMEVIRHNNRLPFAPDEVKSSQERDALVSAIYSLMVNAEKPYAGGEKIKSLKDIIGGKHGIIRGAILGKRVNFSARTVITPNPKIPIGSVGVPEVWVRSLTPSELVTADNLAYLTSLLRAGKIVRVTPGDGPRKGSLVGITEKMRQTWTLYPGDSVDRHLQNGDWLILNRQPTLHKEGLMGHEVIIVPFLTIQLNPTVVTPYAADFDGDEMNVHIPRSQEALREVMEQLNLHKRIMNAQTSTPMIGFIQDAVTAAGLLTAPERISRVPLVYNDVQVSPDVWNDLLVELGSVPQLATLDLRLLRQNVRKYTGKALFSALLPEGFYYRKSTDGNDVRINDGILVSGTITSEHVGPGAANSIQHRLLKDISPEAAATFLDQAPRILQSWLQIRGFSVGTEDCRPTEDIKRISARELARMRSVVGAMGQRPEEDFLAAEWEKELVAHLDRVRDVGAVGLRDLPEDNAFSTMARLGAKGNPLNIAQIMIMLAQQFSSRTARLPLCMTNGGRASIYFDVEETDPEARGFCVSSLYQGLNPAEFAMHAQAGRMGLMDSSVSVSDIGYIRRKLSKALEDFMTRSDGSVRDASENILEFVSGSDGLAPDMMLPISFGDARLTVPVDVTNIVNTLNARHGY